MTNNSTNTNLKEAQEKLEIIKTGINNNAFYDWDITILLIPIISTLIATILLINNISFNSLVISSSQDNNLPCGIIMYINIMCVLLIFACPPFILALPIKYLVSKFRRKFYKINLDPCIFTRRNTAYITAILLPFILNFPFHIFDFVTNSLKPIKFFSITQITANEMNQIFHLETKFTLEILGILIFIFLMVLHFGIYFIYTSIYKVLDKNYKGQNFIKILRHISRSTFLTWLIPFVLSILMIILFYLIM